MELTEVEVVTNKKKIFSSEEAFQASLKYFKGDELAARVWVNKYALKDSHGNIYELTPDDMHWRLAREIARIERNYPNPLSEEKIYSVLKDFKYIVPQGGPMTGIGNEFQVASLSNCFVIGNDGSSDSYGGIMKIDQEQVQLMKRRLMAIFMNLPPMICTGGSHAKLPVLNAIIPIRFQKRKSTVCLKTLSILYHRVVQ